MMHKRSFNRRVLWVLLVTAGLLSGGLLALPSAYAAPKIEWAPSALSKVIATGGIETVIVSITPAEDIRQPVAIRVVPALSPFVTVSPQVFSTLSANQPVSVRITLSAALNAPLGSFDGTIQLRPVSGPSFVISRPLPINLTICQCGAIQGASLSYSSMWQSGRTDRLYRPDILDLQTSADAYSNGGVLNNGAAAIVVSRDPLTGTPLGSLIQEDTRGRKTQSTENVFVGGMTGTRVKYTDWNSPVSETWGVAVYITTANSLYRFLLIYHVGDPREQQYLDDFERILSTVRFSN